MIFKNAEQEIVNDATTGLEPKEKERFLRDYSIMKKSMWLTFWLCLFLGIFGTHQFYLKNNNKGWLYILLSIMIIAITFNSNNPFLVILSAIGQAILIGLIIMDLLTFIRITNDTNRRIVDLILLKIAYKKSYLNNGKAMPTFDDLILMDVTSGMSKDKVIEFKEVYYKKRKSEWITFWLCILCGGMGLHQFYLRNFPKGWLFVALTALLVFLSLGTKESGMIIIFLFLAISIGTLNLYDLCRFIKITKEFNYIVADSILASMNKSR